jgi:hypothetical protein
MQGKWRILAALATTWGLVLGVTRAQEVIQVIATTPIVGQTAVPMQALQLVPALEQPPLRTQALQAAPATGPSTLTTPALQPAAAAGQATAPSQTIQVLPAMGQTSVATPGLQVFPAVGAAAAPTQGMQVVPVPGPTAIPTQVLQFIPATGPTTVPAQTWQLVPAMGQTMVSAEVPSGAVMQVIATEPTTGTALVRQEIAPVPMGVIPGPVAPAHGPFVPYAYNGAYAGGPVPAAFGTGKKQPLRKCIHDSGYCCGFNPDAPTCMTLHEHLRFIFGSCRSFFGEPCLPRDIADMEHHDHNVGRNEIRGLFPPGTIPYAGPADGGPNGTYPNGLYPRDNSPDGLYPRGVHGFSSRYPCRSCGN